MSKSKWWKNKETGEVVLQTGSNRQNMGTVFYRVRSGETFSETKSKFFSSHTQIEASGFPAERPKEFKPRYAIHDWPEGEAYVEEFEPGKFKVVLKDGQEFLREGGIGRYFAQFFRDGSWKVVSEEEALARLDKPKPPVPAAEQFGPGPWYGAGLKYVYYPEGFYVYKGETQVGWVAYEVVQNLWDLNMVSKERPRSTIERVSTILDVPKTAFKYIDGETYRRVTDGVWFHPERCPDGYVRWYSGTPVDTFKKLVEEGKFVPARLFIPHWARKPAPTKPKKKVLMEWAIVIHSSGACRTELWPESQQAPPHGLKCFKTGRTVEVQE